MLRCLHQDGESTAHEQALARPWSRGLHRVLRDFERQLDPTDDKVSGGDLAERLFYLSVDTPGGGVLPGFGLKQTSVDLAGGTSDIGLAASCSATRSCAEPSRSIDVIMRRSLGVAPIRNPCRTAGAQQGPAHGRCA